LHPWPLLATYHASLAGLPMTCIMVADGGYDFQSVEHHFKHLEERLDAASLEQVSHELSRWMPPRTVSNLQSKLFSLIPQIISVVYNPSGSSNAFVATIRDIHDKQSMMMMRNRRRSATIDDEERLRRRSSNALELLEMEAAAAQNGADLERENNKLRKERLRLIMRAALPVPRHMASTACATANAITQLARRTSGEVAETEKGGALENKAGSKRLSVLLSSAVPVLQRRGSTTNAKPNSSLPLQDAVKREVGGLVVV